MSFGKNWLRWREQYPEPREIYVRSVDRLSDNYWWNRGPHNPYKNPNENAYIRGTLKKRQRLLAEELQAFFDFSFNSKNLSFRPPPEFFFPDNFPPLAPVPQHPYKPIFAYSPITNPKEHPYKLNPTRQYSACVDLKAVKRRLDEWNNNRYRNNVRRTPVLILEAARRRLHMVHGKKKKKPDIESVPLSTAHNKALTSFPTTTISPPI